MISSPRLRRGRQNVPDAKLNKMQIGYFLINKTIAGVRSRKLLDWDFHIRYLMSSLDIQTFHLRLALVAHYFKLLD